MIEDEELDDSVAEAVEDENDGPVDIIKIQQDFYESLKPNSSDESTQSYSEVMNKQVINEMIMTNAMFNANMTKSEMTTFSNCLWEQRKFTGSDVLRISQLFVCCVYDKTSEISYPLNIKSSNFAIRPIYRVHKCFKKTQNQRNCCAVFVDEFARVYKTWENFYKKNKYGNCLIIAPKGGFYSASALDKVELDIFYQKDGIIKYFDHGSSVASLGSAAVLLVGFIPAIPVAPVIATSAVAAGAVCAGYTVARSVYQLFDRKKHDQSIGLGNKESRAAYFTIGSGVICAGAGAMTQAALNQETISDVVQKTIRYVNIAGIGFQVAGTADELHSIISDLIEKKPISAIYFAQFCAQIFFLATTVRNYRLTENLMEVSGERNSKSIREIIKQHNSDGSFKNLFIAADFIDKNICVGVSSPFIIQSILRNPLNVAENVKNDCEKFFDQKLVLILQQLVSDKQIKSEESKKIRILLEYFLSTMDLNSLHKFLELTKKCVIETANMHKIKANYEISFEVFLKSIYMLLIQEQDNFNNTNINDLISSSNMSFPKKLFGDFLVRIKQFFSQNLFSTQKNTKIISAVNDFTIRFEMMTDDIKLNDSSIIDLCAQFDNNENICAELKVKLGFARKMYLKVEQHRLILIEDFKKFIIDPIEKTLEKLKEAIDYVLRRLTIESATLFFGVIKQILNECVGSFVNQKFSNNDFIIESFQWLLKVCNGNLTILEKVIKQVFNDDNYEVKKELLDAFLSSKENPTLEKCKECGGETFI